MNVINPRAHRAICRPVQFVSGEAGSLVGFRLKLSSKNLPVVIRGQYRTAAASSSQAGSDDWSRKRNPLNASGSSFSGTRDIRRILNFFGPFKAARRFFRALHHLRQEPRSVFAVLFRPCLSVRFIHANKHGANDVRKIRKSLGEVRYVVR